MEIFVKTLLFSRKCGNMMIAFVGRERSENCIMHESTNDIEMTNEEYRKRLIAIFAKMESTGTLHFWYKYISAIEKEED